MVMKNVMGIINLNETEMFLEQITQQRPLAAVPFAGRYRLIDFVLSNMVNSGIHNVGIMVRHKYRSLLDHLRSGKEWDLDRKWEGLYILPPAQGQSTVEFHKGDLENFYANMDYIKNSRQKYVLVTSSNMVCNLDYRKVFEFHNQTNADITLIYKDYQPGEADLWQSTIVEVDENNRVTDMEINPIRISSNKLSMEMYIMDKQLLLDLIDACVSRGDHNLVRDGIIKNIHRLKVCGYKYTGHLSRIYSTQSYYERSMELLQPEIWCDLFLRAGLIYTKVKDEAPAKYMENSKVLNSLVANGCVIEGRVENSILFRGVKIHKGAYVKDSIIMQKSEIGENAVVENIICDKDVHITRRKNLKGEKNYPIVIAKGTVI